MKTIASMRKLARITKTSGVVLSRDQMEERNGYRIVPASVFLALAG